MSTNVNLPAGFTITSINGKRCTQVPRSLTSIAGETSFGTTTSETPAAQSTTSTTPQSTTSSAQTQGTSPNVAVYVIYTSSTAPTILLGNTAETESEITTSSIPLATVAPTSSVSIPTITPAAGSNTSTSETSTSASPASKGTAPTISSSTSLPVAQSEVSPTPTSTGISNDGFLPPVSSSSTSSFSSTTSVTFVEESSAAAGISSNPKLSRGPVVGGVIGGLALVGIIGVLLWFFRRRRRRNSSLTPLTTRTKERLYEIDSGSVGPTKRRAKWKARLGYQTDRIREAATGLLEGAVGMGESLKSKVVRDRSDTPSVNLKRGNSQFLDGPIQQHSRNNSSVLSNHTGHKTIRERLNEWWERFTESVHFNLRLRGRDRQSMAPFASARGMAESQANVNDPPNFSQLLGMDDRELQLQAERRRASISQSFPTLGRLGLEYSGQAQAIADPFADPPANSITKGPNQPWALPNPSSKPDINPFADPINAPERSIPKQQTYIADTRRSRRLSIDTTNPNLPPSTSHHSKTNSVALTSRYPSSIAPSRGSYRDTVSSSISASTRKGKGRSDPFDLERTELWPPKNKPMPMPLQRDSPKDPHPDPLRMSRPRGQPTAERDSRASQARIVSAATPSNVSAVETYGPKYSSGMSSLDEWGDPGPDLGSGSGSFGQEGSRTAEGDIAWDQKRQMGNVSPVGVESKASSKGVLERRCE